MNSYYKELPLGYRKAVVFDVTETKSSIVLNISNIIVFTVIFVLTVICGGGITRLLDSFSFRRTFVAIILAIVYVVFHELVHGLMYKNLTGQKLTFGCKLNAAFCGVPDIYTSRKTALLSTSAPFVVFLFVFLPLLVWFRITNIDNYFIMGFLLSFHISGCIGDLYVMYLFLFKYKDQRCLMNDTGPKMTIYVPE